MITADHHGRAHPARAHELVDRQSCTRAIAVAEPADPRGQTLELDATGGKLEPATEEDVVREELSELDVDRLDVRSVSRERCPPKWSDAATEKRPDIGRDEARVCKGVRYAGFMGLPS